MSKKNKKSQVHAKSVPRLVSVAPGQALGYGLQYTRLTFLLLDAPEGTFCSFEVLDDVAQQNISGKVVLNQTKSALTGNPASNRSVELWKSLHNWVRGIQEGIINPDTTEFVLYISKSVSGSIIEAFSNAKTESDALKAIELAKETLWGTGPKYPLKANLPDGLSKHANPVLEAKASIVLPFVRNFRLEFSSGSPLEDLKAKLKCMPISPKNVDVILEHICGWVKVAIDSHLENNRPAVVSRDKFSVEFRAFVRKLEQEEILHNFASEPSMSAKHSELPKLYVQQLNLIGLEFEDKLEAISDYLRASYNRTKWAQRGDVHESSYDELDSNLKRSWKHLKLRIEAEGKAEELDRGRILYSECMQHKTLVAGMEPPDHFVPGCFHHLSNEQHLGWHPRYRELLSTVVRKKNT